MTAPTEAEIRELIQGRVDRFPIDNGRHVLKEAVEKAFSTIEYIELDAAGRYDFGTDALSDTWADLSSAQVQELRSIIRFARARALDAAWSAIVDEVVRAGLAFGAQHPDVSRAPREAVPA